MQPNDMPIWIHNMITVKKKKKTTLAQKYIDSKSIFNNKEIGSYLKRAAVVSLVLSLALFFGGNLLHTC